MTYTNHLADLRMFAKDTMQNLHWSLDDIENSDYAELMEIMNTTEADKIQDPMAMMNLYQSLD
ncbi:hypothetical protein [Weissella confusa]|jgi:hypothetical protein|uniref:hypothetical protein n=1 Tax=Weissella confusa TaxID=1583 RepID=UPI0021A8E6C7|nr:hypothetical protein [Weissella confusa]MCT2911811.1 hypothetical protein [Weissella confusa]MDA5459048.1 hypothetical protein [Weissella confusa]MDY2528747.1 hypothetical protein [Weissella confusa]WEY48265.1 hypothetical protein P3T51_00410 [Weissella confusa]